MLYAIQWAFGLLKMFAVHLIVPGTRGGRGGEGHEGHERKQGRTLNTSWIMDSQFQSFFVSWKSVYRRSFSKGGTFLLASARITNWSMPYTLSTKDQKRGGAATYLPQLQEPINNLNNDTHCDTCMNPEKKFKRLEADLIT